MKWRTRGAIISRAVLTMSLGTPAIAQTAYEYDALSRVTKAIYADDYVIEYQYDDAGNRTNVETSTLSAPSFAIDDVSEEEGDSIVFTVTRTGETALETGVDYATADDTASSSSDYASTSGTLTFSYAEYSKTITVSTSEDTDGEDDETFYVNLSSATGGATIGDSQGLGTIENDDNLPPVAVNDYGEMFSSETKDFSVLANDYDPDEDTLTITDEDNIYASIVASGTKIRVQNVPGSANLYINYTISDGNDGEDEAVLNVQVTYCPFGPCEEQ